jgi:hypothetical protein
MRIIIENKKIEILFMKDKMYFPKWNQSESFNALSQFENVVFQEVSSEICSTSVLLL